MRAIRIAAAVLVIPASVGAQGAGPDSREATVFAANVSVLSLMSAEQATAAGLNKLSPAELRALSSWVRTHSLQVASWRGLPR